MRPSERLSLRVATAAAVLGLLLAGATALDWARFEARTTFEGQPLIQPQTHSGLSGPVGMAGKIIAGLGGLAAAAASFIVFTRGRGAMLTASRWLVYCAGFFVLALYFLFRAWQFDTFQATLKRTGEPVELVKQANLAGWYVATVLSAAGALVALAGSYVSRGAPRA